MKSRIFTESLEGVPEKDRADLAELIDHLKTSTYKGQPGYFAKNKGGTVKAIISRCTVEASDRRIQGLLRRYTTVIAKALGFKQGWYSSGGYRSMKDDPLRKDPHGAGHMMGPSIHFEGAAMKTRIFTEVQRRALVEATSITSLEDILQATFDTSMALMLHGGVGWTYATDIAEHTGVSLKVINSWLGKAERKGLVTSHTVKTRSTGGRRPSGTPLRRRSWHLTPKGRKLIGEKSVLDD